MQGLEGTDHMGTSPVKVDIYNLSAIQKLPKVHEESFFARYARGDWSAIQHTDTPPALEATPTLTKRGLVGALNAARPQQGPGTGIGIGTTNSAIRDSPPDLTQSVEYVYRSFLSDGYRTTRSDSLTTRDSSQFDFGTGSRGESERRVTSRPASYEAYHARRYAELGYFEAPLASNEEQRRNAVRMFKPVPSKLDPNLDRIIQLGQIMLSTYMSAFSLVDADEVQTIFGGCDPRIVPRGMSTCSHAVLVQNDEPFVVLDTLKDWRFKGNKLLTEDLKVRFYAGCPIRTEEGENIGVFCVLDDKPHTEFTMEERKRLKELTIVMYRELQGLAYQRQRELQNRIQLTIEMFTREAVTGGGTMDQLLRLMVDHISDTLSVEGVLVFDAQGAPHGRFANGELQAWHNQVGQPLPIMAASEHVAQLSETNNATGGNSIMDAMFRDYPNGLLYTQGDKLPSPFEDLLPEVATSAAAVPISKGKSEPFALICIYTLRPDYHFQLPDATLSFLRSLGLVFCSVQQKQVLSLADKAKVDFIANISHELRTPLHGVIASCDLLSETSLDDAQESFLNTARQCASSLTETINHVLDFTKSTSQSTGHSREAVDLSQLIEETMTGCWLGRISSSENNPSAIGELYSPQNLEQTDSNSKINTKVEPLIEIEPLSNWTVMVDKAGLRRILINLIGNSMKFTQDGYIKLSLSRGIQKDAASLPIEIVVEDTGSGMSGTFMREKLFHPFSQEKPFAQGIGLGLAIVRAILKSPGIDGSIDVQSQVGKGTRMSLHFEAPLVVESTPTPWIRCPSSTESSTLPSVAFVGFPESSLGSWKLAELLRQHLIRWYGSVEELDSTEAKTLILNADYIVPEWLNEPLRYTQKLVLVASNPIDKSLLKAAQELSLNGGFYLVTLKPIGPLGFSKLVSRVVDSSPLINPTPITKEDSRNATYPKHSPVMMRSSLGEAGTLAAMASNLSSDVSGSFGAFGGSPSLQFAPRALVVEDNAVNRKVLSAYLRSRGFDFVETENGKEGVNIFEKHPRGHFDICLMDLQMPVMDGFEATAAIRKIEKERINPASREDSTERLRVYALSGLASLEDKERATTIGFDGYLVKPVSLKTLDSVFRSLPPRARRR